jgi:hypothetical protein
MRRLLHSLPLLPLVALSNIAMTQSSRPIEAVVRMVNGWPTILLNNVPESPVLYSLTDTPAGRWSWEELPQHNIAQFLRQGIRIVQLDLFMDFVWLEEGRFDIGAARRQIAGVTALRPDAAVILRCHVTPPRWWMLKHPEEWVAYADVGYMEEHREGLTRILEEDNYPVRRVSLASTVWREEGHRRLRQFLTELAATPEGNSLAGIQVADGIYGEWHNWGFFRNEPDVGEPMNRAFREWLARTYRTDAALRQAWNRNDVDLKTARVPGVEERRIRGGIIRDPARERQAIDYFTCLHEMIAERIIGFARVVRTTWPRPILVGTFYGYFFSTFSRQAVGGHLALGRILRAPEIDYLSGPQAYEPESLKPGDPYRSRSLILSVRMHGKLWLDEMDVDANVPIPADHSHDLKLRSSIATVRRNVLFSFTKGMGLWFYDFGVGGADLDGVIYPGRGSQGTWDHPAVLEDIGAMKRLIDRRRAMPYRSGADVLYVYDTESFAHTGSLLGSDPVSNTLLDYASLAAFRSGVVFDPVHLDDLETIDLSPYRVVVFANVFLLSPGQRQFIREHVATGGRTIVWNYAPGYSDGKTLVAGRISELTGIGVSPVSLDSVPTVRFRSSGDTTVAYRVGTAPFGPLFAVTDPDAEVLGRYVEGGGAAIARKKFADHVAWYVALPSKVPEPYRTILQSSGAHVYARQGESVYAGGGIVVVHTGSGGPREVLLRNGKRLAFDLPAGPQTLVLDSETGEALLPVR